MRKGGGGKGVDDPFDETKIFLQKKKYCIYLKWSPSFLKTITNILDGQFNYQ